MYAVLKDKKPIAFHDELKVVKRYRKGLLSDHNIDTDIRQITRKKLKRIEDYRDYYLVRYGDTYIQSKFLMSANIDMKQIVYDFKYTKDILFRILEIPDDLTEEDKYHIEKVIEILMFKLDNVQGYTPTITELQSLQTMYDEYKSDGIDVMYQEDKPWI